MRPGCLAAPDGLLQVAPDLSAVRRARPKNKEADSALGHIRDRFRTQQIHTWQIDKDRLLHLRVTGGQHHDSTQARAWVEAWTGALLFCLIADRAYDSDAFRVWLAQQNIEAVIPARRRRTPPSPTTRNGTRRATP